MDQSTSGKPIKLRKKGLGIVRQDQPYPSVKQYANKRDLEEFENRIKAYIQQLEQHPAPSSPSDEQQHAPK